MKESKEWADNLGGSEAISKGSKTYWIVGDVKDRLGGIFDGSRGQTMTGWWGGCSNDMWQICMVGCGAGAVAWEQSDFHDSHAGVHVRWQRHMGLVVCVHVGCWSACVSAGWSIRVVRGGWGCQQFFMRWLRWVPSHMGVNPKNMGTRPRGRGIPMSILPRDAVMTSATASTWGKLPIPRGICPCSALVPTFCPSPVILDKGSGFGVWE